MVTSGAYVKNITQIPISGYKSDVARGLRHIKVASIPYSTKQALVGHFSAMAKSSLKFLRDMHSAIPVLDL
jgi:hypothetical protein